MAKSKVDVSVYGMNEVVKKLKEFPNKFRKSTLRGAIRASAKVVLNEAKKRVPIEEGVLRDSLKIVKVKSINNKYVSYVITTTPKGFHGIAIELGTYAKRTLPLKNPLKQNYGKRGAKRRKVVAKGLGMVARPFLRPALEYAQEEALNEAKRYIIKRLGDSLK